MAGADYLAPKAKVADSTIQSEAINTKSRSKPNDMKQTRVAIYTRVSTDDQSTKTQEHELRQYAKHRGWTVQRVYTDHGFSGALEKRPALDELLRDTRKRKFDVVLVWKFDRFARSLRQLVSALELFRNFGIGFVSATEAIDTSLPSGELVFQIFGAIAQFERALIGERVKAGLGQARRNGKRIGRPPIRSLTPEERIRIHKEHLEGVSLRSLAKSYGISLWSAHSTCRRSQ
jgi:DNA invertase Pin-like site-specific DNA recombinase